MKASTMRIVTLLCATCFAAAVWAREPDETAVDFTRQVQPLLARTCFACHGNDEEMREAELRLDVRADATRDRDGRRAIVPGDSAASELVRRITSSDDQTVMPPADTGVKLTADEVALLSRWIDQGAEYTLHWSFQPPRRPARPQVADQAWPRNGLDYFVLSQLERRRLAPSAEADRYALARRLALDLTGLPPAPEEVDAFVADDRPGAYLRLVDRLLASPRFGERWAGVWLDLARYADSMGYEKDLPRTIWRYRDWVIAAHNEDLPFDRFTTLQLAGDMLADAAPDQILATAMHRNTLTNQEGGTDDEEFRVAAVKDRVDTTLQVWMGLTMGCAKCHSHKYDPLAMHDYYSMFAIFNQTADADRGDDAPTLATPTALQAERIAALDPQIAELRKRLGQFHEEMQADFDKFLAEPPGESAKTPDAIAKLLAVPADQRSDQQRAQLKSLFARHLAPQHAALRDQLAALEKQRAAVEPPKTPVMRELPAAKRRTTHLHVRGNFLEKGEVVAAALPAAFDFLAADVPRDRRGLSRWLVDPQNPLTARVQVNRVWARLFGRGLVPTEEDFGTQGAPPSHPLLLDWLAVEYVENGWSLKHLLRTIVTSATYRQTARVSEQSREQDAANRWLARGPRFRLEAETVRDQALAAAGLLVPRIGGPSVMPPQPPGIWRVTYSKLKWETSTGADRYRRALYTYWRRTSPYPSLMTFDAGSRETCIVRRVRTNTPLQALVTMNDPVYVEAAGGLAERVTATAPATPAAGIAYAFRRVLVRPPAPQETDRLLQLYQQAREHFAARVEEAKSLIAAARAARPQQVAAEEFAAWIVVGNVLLNLDETMMKN